ncbi:MAG TPA: SDR family NAD(P)-dependent oxidoreductase [Streptosporangiaceae bacterium]|nr:SDR family NAD(P)-dependent oxidoreductase [Streptosporangiaceae bacterium]
MLTRTGHANRPGRVLLLGGTSEIGLAILAALHAPPATEILLAGRDPAALAGAGTALPYKVQALRYDALEFSAHETFAGKVFADGPVDLVISAAGVLIPQPELDRAPAQAATLIGTNLTGHVTTLLACANRMRAQDHGTIVVLSSIAAVRPRKANLVYGAAKAGLDAFARGLADALHGSGVRVLLVRPGFVTGRMTAGMIPAPLATTPAAVGQAVATALAHSDRTVWVPRSLAFLAAAMRLIPRPLWRRLRR